MDVIDRIEALFAAHGQQHYEGRRAESVSALAHALQCAQLAELAHAPAPMVAAALLHDLGHFVARSNEDDAVDDDHEHRAFSLLSLDFGRAVLDPIRLHVQAKRYLVATDARYAGQLSPASVHSLRLQGGPMAEEEQRWFESLPYAEDAVALRRWDDLAKQPAQRTPPLAYYLALLQEVRTRPALPAGSLA
ncbi:MAG: phosphohydrolase [Burkholderiales bacterium]|nr:phosphohydrolase [Burkholderiales bacterium]